MILDPVRSPFGTWRRFPRLPFARLLFALCPLLIALCALGAADDGAGLLGGLARPQDGRSMRATSTFRQGKDGKYDPHARPKGDLDEKSNYDNFRVAPGATGRSVEFGSML